MKIVMTNLGSLGDVQPLLALAHELRSSGHRPVLALAPLFAARVRELGFDHVAMGPDLDFREIDRRAITMLMGGADPLEVMQESLGLLSNMLPEFFSTLDGLCRDADVLVSGHLQPAAQMIHELTQIPFVSIQVNHFGGRRAAAEREALGGVINAFRRGRGLAPLADAMHSDANSPQLALYAMSRHLGIATEGWPEHYHLTGFFFMDEDGWEPPPELTHFLSDGEPPVVVSFSSLTHEDPEAVTRMILEAVRLTGRRAVVQHGWSGLAEGRMPAGVHAAGFVPHSWLFPRAACVVHHGGAQTSAAVFRAGVPAVVVPHVRDQPVWAELSRDLGVAVTLASAELSAERLAAAITEALARPGYRAAAVALGAKIRSERGVERARQLIETLAGKVGLSRESAMEVAALGSAERLERAARRTAYRTGRRAGSRQQEAEPGEEGRW